MPFDMAPQETKVGQFQKYADSILRGCAMTQPAPPKGNACLYDAYQNRTHACVFFAMKDGGMRPDFAAMDSEYFVMARAYRARYGNGYIDDYTDGAFTREQIAARIAAL